MNKFEKRILKELSKMKYDFDNLRIGENHKRMFITLRQYGEFYKMTINNKTMEYEKANVSIELQEDFMKAFKKSQNKISSRKL